MDAANLRSPFGRLATPFHCQNCPLPGTVEISIVWFVFDGRRLKPSAVDGHNRSVVARNAPPTTSRAIAKPTPALPAHTQCRRKARRHIEPTGHPESRVEMLQLTHYNRER